MNVLRLFYGTYKALEPMALDLRDEGFTECEMYRMYKDYKTGYELARAELLESLGISVSGIDG